MANPPITVLLFEDDDSQALLTREALEQAGCQVDVCRNGRDGLARMFTRDYQVYLVDIKLPDINGVELLRRITAVKPGAVVIVVTGHGDETAAVEAMKLGAYDYIVKSPSMGHLAALPFVIREGSDRSQMKHEREALRTEVWEHARLLEERNAELRRLHRDLKLLARLRSDLLSLLNHDLQEPLNRLKEDLKQKYGEEAVHPSMEELERQIEGIRELVRIGTGRIDLAKRFLDPALLIQQITQLVRPGLEPKQVQIVMVVPSSATAIFADPDKVGHSLRMMIAFAAAKMEGAGRIMLRWEPGATESSCSVLFEAQGNSLSPSALSGRGNGSASDWPDGELSLSIGRRLIELHDGTVWSNGMTGRSGAFGFTLPNRTMQQAFGEYMRQGIELARQEQRGFSIIAFLVKGLPQLRETYGAQAVDGLLASVEKRLNDMVRQRSGDQIIRGPNGEMAVILAQVGRVGSLVIADRTRRMLESQPWLVGTAQASIGFHAAMATYPEEASTPEAMLRLVEERMTPPAATPSPKPAEAKDDHKKKILVADDEPEILEELNQCLSKQGYHVLTAKDGQEALDIALRERPQLILLDVLMPVLDGYACLRKLNASLGRGAIPVIVLTSRDYMKDLFALEGVEDYLIKPFNPEDLIQRVELVLKRRSTKAA